MEYSVEVRRRFAAALAVRRCIPAGCEICTSAEAEDRTLGVWARAHIGISNGRIVAAQFDVWGCPDTIAAADLAAERLRGVLLEDFRGLDARAMAQELDVPTQKLGKLLRLEDAALAAAAAAREQIEKGIDNGSITH
ncbi:MAG: iron-sulfur cluster assembly scaffold protein [Gammaproteobacteria bacterium]|nr:iron-sulfur cluster assembly scaffold protein [Gammaproteobacteria bacterium]